MFQLTCVSMFSEICLRPLGSTLTLGLLQLWCHIEDIMGWIHSRWTNYDACLLTFFPYKEAESKTVTSSWSWTAGPCWPQPTCRRLCRRRRLSCWRSGGTTTTFSSTLSPMSSCSRRPAAAVEVQEQVEEQRWSSSVGKCESAPARPASTLLTCLQLVVI